MTNDSNINISVTFRHTDSTPALKAYAVEKINHISQKFVTAATEVHVVLCVEKRDHIAEVIFHSGRYDVTAKSVESDLYAAIDRVCDSLEAQLRKHKDRAVDHKNTESRDHFAAE